MRWLIVLILVLLAAFYLWPEPEVPDAEDTFIGEQVRTLRKAEGYEDEYLKANEERRKALEEELEKASGGG